jgi:hypothetical protein
MEIVEPASMSYDDYVKGIEECNRTSPIESSYQYIIKKVFDAILKNTNIEAINSMDFPRECTKRHCHYGYKIINTSSPDLILAENFIYHNRINKNLVKPKYHALVEIKIPNAIKITDNKNIRINKKDEEQLNTYLTHPNINKLIFTDGYTWIFFEDFKHKKIVNLRDGMKWKHSQRVLDNSAENLLEANETRSEPKEWGELTSYILNFLMEPAINK